MKNITSLKYTELKKLLNSGELASETICNAYLDRIEIYNPKINAFLRLDRDKVVQAAKASDQRRKAGKALSEFDGIPIAIKDNICIENEITSCASKILENYKSPYHAHVITRLLEHGFVLIPGTNMDEFAMGSSTENSSYQITANPFDTDRIPGGSSGGSAAAVASGMVPLALGSDTGGSIRQPASLCGIFGLKPTYGRVSRYGLIAYASSFDQIGPLANDNQGVVDVLSVISGYDVHDSSSSTEKGFATALPAVDPGKLTIGIMANEGAEWQPDVKERFDETLALLKAKGAKIVELDFSLQKYSVPIYYLLATAECSSNLSRFDGIRYGQRVESDSLEKIYVESRTRGFGKEVQRRILLGTFSLSAGYYDAYYGKAQKARILIRNKYDEFFKQVDFILQPTSPTTAFKIGEKSSDPVQMYKADIMTTSVNLAGIPAISVPMGLDKNGLPVGLQVTAPAFAEPRLLAFTGELEKMLEAVKLPETIG